MVLDHDEQLEDLQAWRNELRGAWKFVSVALGASVLSAIASIASIVFLASQLSERVKP